MRPMRERHPDHILDMLVIQHVVPPPSILPGADEILLAQYPKLVRYGRFAQADRRRDIADAHLAPSQRGDDSKPRGIAEDREHRGKRRDLMGRGHTDPRLAHRVHMDDPVLTGVIPTLGYLVDFSRSRQRCLHYMNTYSQVSTISEWNQGQRRPIRGIDHDLHAHPVIPYTGHIDHKP